MTKLIYQDQKSHKFWIVQQKENELHLNWGRVGTLGQSQVKSFDNNELAEKAKAKLIKDKKKKGYQPEDAPKKNSLSVTSASEKSVTPSASAPENAAQPTPSALSKPTKPATTSPFWLSEDETISLPLSITQKTLGNRAHPYQKPEKNTEENTHYLQNLKRIVQKITKDGPVTLDSSRCFPEWQPAFTLARQCLEQGLPLPKESPMAGAIISRISADFTRYYYSRDDALIDNIVGAYGLEYAIELLIACQKFCITDRSRLHQYGYYPENGSQSESISCYFNDAELHVRQHLSVADPALWQRCADRLVAAIDEIAIWRQPLISVLLPEKPEIADGIVQRAAGQKQFTSLEWLKLTATHPATVQALNKYLDHDIFNDHYRDANLTATLLLDQGVNAIPRLAPYAAGSECSKVLTLINHPTAMSLLIQAASRGKSHFDYMVSASKRFPHATLAALAELLATRNESLWRTQLLNMLYTQPQLSHDILPWVSPQAAAIIEQSLQQINTQTNIASTDRLPSILISPPWLSKKQKSIVPVLELPLLPLEPTMEAVPWPNKGEWHAERIRVASTASAEEILSHMGFRAYKKSIDEPAIQAYLDGDYEQLIKEWTNFHSRYISTWELYILAGLPAEKAIPMWSRLSRESHVYVQEVLSCFGLAALDGFINSVGRQPQESLPLAIYVGATELAPLIGRAYSKLKTLRDDARRWLLKYPEHAITGLLPAALGKPCEARDNARMVLNLLANNGHQPLIQKVAARYQQPEVIAALEALQAIDPLDNYPARRPALPAFYQPVLWTRPQLHTGESLPDEALMHIGTMLRFPAEGGIYAGLLQVKEACTPDSLAAFAWDMFIAWQAAGAPSKENWAFTAMGLFGNDDIARRLTPLIRTWPGESQHKRAVLGLDILAAIGSDIALMQLNGIAQKIKFTALKARAREKIMQIAEQRELTVAELEDRLAPDLGLDEQGSLLLDFGSRQFTVSFDEALKPFVRDASGSRLKTLPKPNKSDDATLSVDAVNRFKALKKDARAIASQQIQRLESAMCLRRRWTPEHFRQFLVEHPLVAHLTRRLVWGVYNADNQLQHCFRVAEDNSYSTADDDLFILPEDVRFIGIPHILEIPPEDAAAFGQLFADYELLPPFRQLDRGHYQLTASERESVDLMRWENRTCPSGRIVGLASKGWLRGQPQDAGWIGWMLKPMGQWTLVLEMSEGFCVGILPDELAETQKLDSIWLWKGKPEDFGWGCNHQQKQIPFSVLDEISASEMVSDIEALFD